MLIGKFPQAFCKTVIASFRYRPQTSINLALKAAGRFASDDELGGIKLRRMLPIAVLGGAVLFANVVFAQQTLPPNANSSVPNIVAGQVPPAAETAQRITPVAPAAPGLDALVGDPDFGKMLFNGAKYKCSTCHTITPGQVSSGPNLSTIGTKYANARSLQNAMLLNRGQGWSPANDKSVIVDLTWKDGRKLSGYMSSVSDFKVILRAEDGGSKVVPIVNGDPKVVIRDSAQTHLDLLPSYSDDDIHDLTAYLASLK